MACKFLSWADRTAEVVFSSSGVGNAGAPGASGPVKFY